MVVKGIGGVAIYAKDPSGLAAWYTKHLGIQALEERRGDGRTCDFYFRDLEDPALRRRIVWSLLRRTGAPLSRPRRFAVHYLVEDLGAAVRRLQAAGITVQEIEERADGRCARLLDPEGNAIELWED